jgi:hypothetical protein
LSALEIFDRKGLSKITKLSRFENLFDKWHVITLKSVLGQGLPSCALRPSSGALRVFIAQRPLERSVGHLVSNTASS